MRESIQSSAVNNIIINDYTGIVDVSPRVGKSRILIDSIRTNSHWDVCICSPYRTIQNSWDREFDKWNLGFKVDNICSKSLSKIPQEIDLLVVDEIQTLSPNQIDWIIRKKPHRILGLTGTLSHETKYNISMKLGIRPIFTYTIDQAIADGIISNFEIILVGCSMDNVHRNIVSGTKKKPTQVTEKGHYDYLTAQFERFRKLSYRDASFTHLKDLYARNRMNFIYTSPSKLGIAKEIVDRLDRCIIFTGRVEQADYLCDKSFHVKNRKDKNLEKFIEEDINKLSVIEMSSMGGCCAQIHLIR